MQLAIDYRPLEENEKELTKTFLEVEWLKKNLADLAVEFAITELVPRHLQEVKTRKEELVKRTLAAVHERLTKEITYWDRQAVKIEAGERAGKTPRLNSARARQRVEDLQARLDKRKEELEQERQLSALPPTVVGGALVIPAGLLASLKGKRQAEPGMFARETKRVELAAMAAVMAAEKKLGYSPTDVSRDNLGYDIESRVLGTGKLRFIEVKGRISGAETVTVTRNEIAAALNKPDDFILALVEVPPSEDFNEGDVYRLAESRASYGETSSPILRYVSRPFNSEPDFGVTSVNYDWKKLWNRAVDLII